MEIDLKKYRISKGKDFKISKYKTTAPGKRPNDEALIKQMDEYKDVIIKQQYRLYAENRQSLLIVLQGMDSAGKDSVIRHLMAGVNPEGLQVYSFKHPSAQELSHDYLWRHYVKLPESGNITIFNRSHYENVLIARVHPEIVLAEHLHGIESVDQVNKKFWEQRYDQIRDFEKVISQNGTQVLKFFLHLSKDEQRKRFMERIEDKEKHWKFSSADIKERQYWKEYQQAYEDAIRHTATDDSPWYVIPADDKWFTHLLCSKIIMKELERMDPQFPTVDKEELKLLKDAKAQLEKEK